MVCFAASKSLLVLLSLEEARKVDCCIYDDTACLRINFWRKASRIKFSNWKRRLGRFTPKYCPFYKLSVYQLSSLWFQKVINKYLKMAMINQLSNRIRNIIRTQEFPHRQQVIRSHDGSMDSIPSYHPHNLNPPHNNQPNISKNTSTHTIVKPSATPIKRIIKSSQGLLQKSELAINDDELLRPQENPYSHFHIHSPSHSNNQSTVANKAFYEDFFEHLKQRIIEMIDPIIKGLENKILLLFEFEERCTAELQRIYKNSDIVQEHFDRKIQHLKKQTFLQAEPDSKTIKSCEHTSERIEEIRANFEKQIKKMEIKLEQMREDIRHNDQNLKRKQEMSLHAMYKQQRQQKCQCKNLVNQILKSQEHLMMELKYVKHFQGLNRPYQNQQR